MRTYKSHVRALMEEKGVSLRELSKKSDVSLQTVINARSDEKIAGCSLATLGKLAEALDVPTKALFEEI